MKEFFSYPTKDATDICLQINVCVTVKVSNNIVFCIETYIWSTKSPPSGHFNHLIMILNTHALLYD